MYKKGLITVVLTLTTIFSIFAQQLYDLNTGWKCIARSKTSAGGEKISQPGFSLNGWMAATVPPGLMTKVSG